jgi:hypothetical protein
MTKFIQIQAGSGLKAPDPHAGIFAPRADPCDWPLLPGEIRTRVYRAWLARSLFIMYNSL